MTFSWSLCYLHSSGQKASIILHQSLWMVTFSIKWDIYTQSQISLTFFAHICSLFVLGTDFEHWRDFVGIKDPHRNGPVIAWNMNKEMQQIRRVPRLLGVTTHLAPYFFEITKNLVSSSSSGARGAFGSFLVSLRPWYIRLLPYLFRMAHLACPWD